MKDKIVEILRGIYDPEIPINIYDLGLVREINIDDEEKRIFIRLIFTANKGCTLADLVTVQVKYKVMRAFPDYKVDAKADYNEEWNIGYATLEGRMMLEEIYGKEAIELLMKKDSKIESLVMQLRINKEDPVQYMRKALDDRYQTFKNWYDKHKIL
ncbi:metal-sulfur cluster assembly factor [Acidianus manzaensis]|uniref:Metal-sulfur cluster biosynthetic enzyme n=1 Tax=Acidianus manzaensis TaxID=282676 RepID=A0A1W6JWT4_9CREN|nr:metal-sulfur cluster assembly factor [Acidianus manzaensis]ARM74699.1 metal-sulfur cluster biosynthetic enzyme [Acidianus manzaensis]